MSEGVTRRVHPQAHVHGEPAVTIVFGVTILRTLVSAQNVFKVAVREDAALGTTDNHQTFGGRIHPRRSPAKAVKKE